MKKTTLLCLLAVLCVYAATAQLYTGRLGVETPSDVFTDIVKQDYRWDKPDGAGGWTALTSGDVDASGWPNTDARFIMDFRPVAEWAGTIDDPDVYRVNRSGVYKGSFEGQATLTPIEGPFTISNQAYNATTNITTFDLTMSAPGPQHGLMVFSFTNTKRLPSSANGSGLKNFRLIRPGYPANTTQVFTNEFISTLTNAPFAVIRFMGVTNTNNNIEWGPSSTLLQNWSNRKKTTDATQTTMPTLNKKDGWAWEYVIQLCNQVNMDMWINIPVSVNDDYITQLATLVKNNLNSNLRVYIEHTNELWNFGFTQYSWNKARAVEEVNAGTANYNYDGVNDQEIWNQRRHAKRVRDAVTIFGNVFGAGSINNRIRGVLAGVTPDPNGFFIGGRLPGMLQYLNANYGPPKNYIYSIAIPLYFGGEAASGGGSTGSFTPQQIIAAMQTTSDNDVPTRQSLIALANTWQLTGGAASYEGGPDIGGGSTTNIANRIRAVRDPAMKNVYKRNFATNWWDIGGQMAMQFTLASSYNRYGAWGLTDDLANPDRNSLFQAVRELIGSSSNNGGTGTGLRAEYFNNMTLTAPVALTRTDATVNFNWGNASPATGINADQFSVRWTGQVEAPATGNYVFSTVSDDGVRLWVNGTQVINNWTDHASTTNNSAAIALTAGQKYTITMEYYENGGGAVAQLLWSYSGQAQQAIPQTRLYAAAGGGAGLVAQYFNNMTLTAPVVLTRTDATIDFNWGNASPGAGVNADGFSVRWTGQVEAPVSGSYTFSTESDDGVRLWVNGTQVINNWTDHPATINNGTAITLTGGQRYYIVMEYYENTVGAVARLLWSYPGQAQQVIPQNRLFTASGARISNMETVDNHVITIYPNPVRANRLNAVVYSDNKTKATIRILSATAQKLAEVQQMLQAGNNRISIPVTHMQNGVHFLVIEKGKERIVKKLIIQR